MSVPCCAGSGVDSRPGGVAAMEIPSGVFDTCDGADSIRLVLSCDVAFLGLTDGRAFGDGY